VPVPGVFPDAADVCISGLPDDTVTGLARSVTIGRGNGRFVVTFV
jgi:hypothetical protein